MSTKRSRPATREPARKPEDGYMTPGDEPVQDGSGYMEPATTQTANYGLPIWQRVLNGTTITVGCDNIFGEDPPKAYGFGGNSTNYPGFLYDATGRFVYVQLTKKF